MAIGIRLSEGEGNNTRDYLAWVERVRMTRAAFFASHIPLAANMLQFMLLQRERDIPIMYTDEELLGRIDMLHGMLADLEKTIRAGKLDLLVNVRNQEDRGT